MASLPAGSYQPFSAAYQDAGGENGNVHGYGKLISAANHDAQVTAWAAVLAAIDALSLGARVKDRYDDETTYSVSRPTNGAAREVALNATFKDATTGQQWTANVVPCLDISLITYVDNINAKDAVDPSTTEVAALTTALEGFPVVNPEHPTNTVNVIGYRVIRGQK